MVKLVKKNGEPVFKTLTPRTRLKFSIAVIIINFIMGIIGMILGTDLTALGVFLAMSNSPLYVYVIGQSFAPTTIPKEYYEQAHGGSGGLGNIVGNSSNNSDSSGVDNSIPNFSTTTQTSKDNYNIPTNMTTDTTIPKPVDVVNKPKEEIG